MRLGTFETYPAIFSTRWAIVLFGARRLAHRGEKEGRVSYGLQPNQYDTDLNEPERHCEKEGERERAHNKMHDQPPIIPSQQRCR